MGEFALVGGTGAWRPYTTTHSTRARSCDAPTDASDYYVYRIPTTTTTTTTTVSAVLSTKLYYNDVPQLHTHDNTYPTKKTHARNVPG